MQWQRKAMSPWINWYSFIKTQWDCRNKKQASLPISHINWGYVQYSITRICTFCLSDLRNRRGLANTCMRNNLENHGKYCKNELLNVDAATAELTKRVWNWKALCNGFIFDFKHITTEAHQLCHTWTEIVPLKSRRPTAIVRIKTQLIFISLHKQKVWPEKARS